VLMRRREEKKESEGKVKRFFKKLSYKTVLPLVAAGCLAVPPVAKHVNPFYSKPALADEVSAEKPDIKKGAEEPKEEPKTPVEKVTEVEDKTPVVAFPREEIKAKSKTDIKLGGVVIANEAGSSISGIAEYGNWGGARYGVLMFGNLEAPFFNIRVTPGLDKDGFKLKYFGTLTFTQLNSWLYSSHSLGFGYGHQGKHVGFDCGVIAGGALSYPKYDDIYLNLMGGLSINVQKWLYLYTVARSYFAADNAMKSAYVMYYKPQWQGIEVGAAVKFHELYGSVFADFDVIQNKYGIKLGTLLNFTPRVKGYVWGGVGATQWREGLGGGPRFMAMAGIKLFIVGENVNTEYAASYEHYGTGGIPLEIDINSAPNNLRPQTPQEIGWENRARANLLESGNMQEFVSKYCCNGASEDEVITVARWLARTLGEVAYANEAEKAMMQWDFFSTSIKDIADASHDDILGFLKQYNEWYEEHGTYEGMPEELLDGIAVCAGIHSTVAEYLRLNGIHAVAITVNSPKEPHVVTMAYTDDKTMIIDYGDIFVGPGDSIDQVVRAYGLYREAPTYNAQIFTEDYVGTWVTPEGRVLHKTIGVENADELKGFFLEIPGY
jgi:hypothetical protein